MLRLTICALMLSLLAVACGAPEHRGAREPSYSTEVRAAESLRFNAWLDEKFDEALARDPNRQTVLGIKTDYDIWTDPSEAFEEAELEWMRATVAEMREGFDTARLDEQARLTWRIMEYRLAQDEAAAPFRHHSYPFNQMFGAQARIPAFLINQHRVASVADAEAYIARLEGIPDYLATIVGRSRQAAEAGIQPPAFVYDYVLADARGLLRGYPFDTNPDEPNTLMADFASKADALVAAGAAAPEVAENLKARAADALSNAAGPAYEAMIAELSHQQLFATADDGVWKLPDGDAYYAMRLRQMTTTDLSATEIHQIGLDEVARIHGEMHAIIQTVGFEGSLADFFEFMRTDPRFYLPDTEAGRAEYIALASEAINRMSADLPGLFHTLPQADLEVRAVEPFRERSAGKAFYSAPAPDGSRPGVYFANLYRMADMPLYQLEALAFHEGVPGHHMQIAIAQELGELPKFRRFGNFTAYSEGWGLYSELIPKELGYYEDPYSDFGRLAMELWRAARLVVDTGLHDQRWTREQAIQYLIENTPNPEGDARRAIDRYIVMPGQATAYSIGMLKILELRQRAQERLGPEFDIRDFHDVVLRSGPVPLSLLEENVDAWLASGAVAASR